MTSKPGDGLTLLVVEDDRRTLAELERILSRHTAFEVLPFHDPFQALEKTRGEVVDMALLDIRLPGLNGLDLLDRLRSEHPDLVALVMTGYGEERTAVESREKGAVDFLEKPLDLSYLLASLGQQSRECQVRKDLTLSLSRTRRLIGRIPDGVALLGEDGQPLVANQLGESLLEETKDGGVEGDPVCRDGKTFTLELSEESGETLYHWRDLSDALEAERGRAYRHMGRLLGHELRNPLTPMRLWLQELQAVPEGDPKLEGLCRQAVEVLLGQVDRLSTLVDQFRALGEGGALSCRSVSLDGVVESVFDAVSPLAKAMHVSMGRPEASEVRVQAHERGLYQVLFNLVRNAVEAQEGKAGEVRIEWSRPDPESIELRVEDQAGGFPQEVADAPFEPYLTTKEGGTGLGLLVCRELLERMGVMLDLENRPGDGVTARFRLKTAAIQGNGV